MQLYRTIAVGIHAAAAAATKRFVIVITKFGKTPPLKVDRSVSNSKLITNGPSRTGASEVSRSQP